MELILDGNSGIDAHACGAKSVIEIDSSRKIENNNYFSSHVRNVFWVIIWYKYQNHFIAALNCGGDKFRYTKNNSYKSSFLILTFRFIVISVIRQARFCYNFFLYFRSNLGSKL